MFGEKTFQRNIGCTDRKTTEGDHRNTQRDYRYDRSLQTENRPHLCHCPHLLTKQVQELLCLTMRKRTLSITSKTGSTILYYILLITFSIGDWSYKCRLVGPITIL
jgi:hypothetical protein